MIEFHCHKHEIVFFICDQNLFRMCYNENQITHQIDIDVVTIYCNFLPISWLIFYKKLIIYKLDMPRISSKVFWDILYLGINYVLQYDSYHPCNQYSCRCKSQMVENNASNKINVDIKQRMTKLSTRITLNMHIYCLRIVVLA